MFKLVADIPENYQLIQDSQDIEAIADHVNRPDLKKFACCLFVLIDNGEYSSIYVTWRSVPYLLESVERIL